MSFLSRLKERSEKDLNVLFNLDHLLYSFILVKKINFHQENKNLLIPKLQEKNGRERDNNFPKSSQFPEKLSPIYRKSQLCIGEKKTCY